MNEQAYLGIDTSNYTTSVALLCGKEITQAKKLLPVKNGEAGLRQSDAVFHHVRQLPQVLSELLPKSIKAIGVSTAPRNVLGSYMPCFLVGSGTAQSLALALDVPLYNFSHQQGHLAAALYSCGRMDLLNGDFLAFHLSGGTSEGLLVKGGVLGDIQIISKTLDINAGQAIDRVGVSLGLDFPAGIELEKLALNSSSLAKTLKPAMKGMDFSLSGIENKCQKMLNDGVSSQDIAAYCINFIVNTIDKATQKMIENHSELPIIFSGGVASSVFLKKLLTKKYKAFFAQPDFSADNAGGIAVLTKYKHDKG